MDVALVDLGFGDAGKGMLTHTLARRMPKGSFSVRFNGGSQAGHTVIDRENRRHVFSQFGSSLFVDGFKSIYSQFCVLHPTALLREAEALTQSGIQSVFEKIIVSERCAVTTPYHQALNHVFEMSRDSKRHGSCGVGFGETIRMREILKFQESAIEARHLHDSKYLNSALKLQKEYSLSQIENLPIRDEIDRQVLRDESWWNTWVGQVQILAQNNCVRTEQEICELAQTAPSLLFEGAQGVLLDENFGFAPFTTWSNCTFRNVHALRHEWKRTENLDAWGVIRTHMVRHGAGPLPTERTEDFVDATNHNNLWQGAPRYGALDFILLRHALRAVPEVKQLAVSHLDTWEQSSKTLCQHYENDEIENALKVHNSATYPRDSITARLFAAKPILESCSNIVKAIENALSLPIRVRGHGSGESSWHPLPNVLSSD